jgi:hypothetical protein
MYKSLSGFFKQTRFKLAFILLFVWTLLTFILLISDIFSSFRMIPFDGIQVSDTANSLISSLTSAALMAISFYFGNKLSDSSEDPESKPDPNQDK